MYRVELRNVRLAWKDLKKDPLRGVPPCRGGGAPILVGEWVQEYTIALPHLLLAVCRQDLGRGAPFGHLGAWGRRP